MKTIKKLYRITKAVIFAPFILRDILLYSLKNQSGRFNISFMDLFPFVFDKTNFTPFDRHYIYHPAWAARKVREINPAKHVDIGSTLTFSTMLSAFIPVEFYDIRPAKLALSDLDSREGSLMNLPFDNDSVHCISCMHTIEHVGLGRYGDPIDPEGDIKAIQELKRVVAKDGYIIFVTPIGKHKLMFNGHRIYSFGDIIEYFSPLELLEFSLIHEHAENGELSYNASKELADKEEYGCGCFLFRKTN